MKKIILTIIVLLNVAFCYAQKLKIKKADLLLDGKAIMKHELENDYGKVKHYLSEPDSMDRKILLIMEDNGTDMNLDDDFIVIKFLTVGKSAEIRAPFIYDAISLLLKAKVITAEGKIVDSLVELFVNNYDEKISRSKMKDQ